MRIAVAAWRPDDGIAEVIEGTLLEQGVSASRFVLEDPIPAAVEWVLSFAPYGRLRPLVRHLAAIAPASRPKWVHWSMECFPSMGIPWELLSRMAIGRSRMDDWHDDGGARHGGLALSWLGDRMTRYRILGDYLRALDLGLLTRLVESSAIFARIYQRQGLDVPYVPWGIPGRWHADLGLERDIDVLWMGIRRTRRRSRWLERIRAELKSRGIGMYVADGEEHPFLYGEKRIRMLNRSTVTLNLLPRWYDPALSFRFVHAAANGSCVVSEPVLPHCPEIETGRHYLAARPREIAATVERVLGDDAHRRKIVSAARDLVQSKLALRISLARVLELVGFR